MMLGKRILRALYGKLADRLPQDEEGKVTLPGELRRVLAQRYQQLTDYIAEVEMLKTSLADKKHGEEQVSDQEINDDDIDPEVLATRNAKQRKSASQNFLWLRNIFYAFKVYYERIPRWLILFLLATAPPLTLGLSFYYHFQKQIVLPGNEEVYRNKFGEPLVRLVYVKDWASSTATAYLIAHLLRTEMDAEVLFKPVAQTELRAAWTMLVENKADVFLSAWMPSQLSFIQAREARDKLLSMGVLAVGARLGLVVPEWVAINSLAELATATNEKNNFGGVIYALDPSAKLNALTRKALEDYQLNNFSLEEKSESVMLHHLRQAMQAAKPIIVAGWTPHAMFGEYALKFLDDPRNVFGDSESIHIVTTKNFAANFNDLCGFLRRVKLTMPQFCDLLYCTRDTHTIADEIKKWVEDHRDLIKEWRTTPQK